jgi:hypothetical protein
MIKKQIIFIGFILALLTTQVIATEVSVPWLAVNNETNSCGIISSTGSLTEELEEDGWELVEKKVSFDEVKYKCKELGYDYIEQIDNSKKELNIIQRIITWIRGIFI